MANLEGNATKLLAIAAGYFLEMKSVNCEKYC
jgi:hypothetical protein